MKKLLIAVAALSVLGSASMMAEASPERDLQKFRNFFFQKFPGVNLHDYGDGIYALDTNRRFEWEAMEEFPPYEDGLELGKKLYKKYGLAKCFRKGTRIKQNYPRFIKKTGKVHTLEGDIMACLKRNKINTKKEGLKYGKGKFAAISAYMASKSTGMKQNVKVPNNKRAKAIYKLGKQHFYAKRGQLNVSCADCHMYNSGMMARGNLLSPALGQTSHFPVWRRKWAKGKGGTAGFGTIQRRYSGCNKQVRAKPLKAKGKQHPEYVALEYFHTYMSNGIKLNGPAVRQ